MPHFEKALEKSVDSTTKRLRGSALYNLGLSHFHSEDLDNAIKYFKESVTSFKEQGYEYLNRILDPVIMLARSYFHNNDNDLGLYTLYQGIELAEKLNDDVMLKVFTFYKALYVKKDYDKVHSDIDYLSKKGMYAILEELSKDAARKYNSVGDKDRASNFYEKVLFFQKLIKRSDCLYEI
ncbi:tetratricopeptide repeat protein [Bacillus pumilus]|uniref:tetratricopeptide repeat protein n=1 Tax=Bacillus pumilus TaxID=1408 RepID=UPI0024910E2A|nr:tetratricopeptide repeat protein [Bacillus pumilus]